MPKKKKSQPNNTNTLVMAKKHFSNSKSSGLNFFTTKLQVRLTQLGNDSYIQFKRSGRAFLAADHFTHEEKTHPLSEVEKQFLKTSKRKLIKAGIDRTAKILDKLTDGLGVYAKFKAKAGLGIKKMVDVSNEIKNAEHPKCKALGTATEHSLSGLTHFFAARNKRPLNFTETVVVRVKSAELGNAVETFCQKHMSNFFKPATLSYSATSLNMVSTKNIFLNNNLPKPILNAQGPKRRPF